MNRILLIGNSGLKRNGTDGQTLKVRLYLKKMKDEGLDVVFIDLENFLKRPFSKLHQIKKSIKTCDRIVLISAERGCKVLIPFINRHNKKYNKPFILPLVGTSVLHYSIDKLNGQEKNDFLLNNNYQLCRPKKRLKKQLAKITHILPETEQLCEVFRNFYNLTNVECLTNFREIGSLVERNSQTEGQLRLLFLSRVMKEKGAFDLINSIKEINELGLRVKCDFYGKLCFDNESEDKFMEYVDKGIISYRGVAANEEVNGIMHDYDLFVFPTRFVGEGVPGVVVESLIAGLPILTSDFPQAKTILKNGVDSIFFKMFDQEDLKNKILYILDNKEILNKLKEGAERSGACYIYPKTREKFLRYVCGVKTIK